jgi:hypothetical protein
MGMAQGNMIDPRQGIVDASEQAQDGTKDAPYEEHRILEDRKHILIHVYLFLLFCCV